MKKTPAAIIAFGGMMAAVAMVIMNLVGLIPVATFVCPMLCMMILNVVIRFCGKRIGWAWYGAVAILSVLMAPDKEAAAIFVFLGYYPLVKPKLDAMKSGMLLKFLFFNSVILLMYWLLINLFGLAQLAQEFSELGVIMTVFTLITGNLIFYMLDRILGRITVMTKWGRK
jgi:hypothetical protein